MQAPVSTGRSHLFLYSNLMSFDWDSVAGFVLVAPHLPDSTGLFHRLLACTVRAALQTARTWR